jgi:diguanylate cyclase (GGDEF)-like protein
MDPDGTAQGSGSALGTDQARRDGYAGLLHTFVGALSADAGLLVGIGGRDEAPVPTAAWDPGGLGPPLRWLDGRFMSRMLESGRPTAAFDGRGDSHSMNGGSDDSDRITLAVGAPVTVPEGRIAVICAGFVDAQKRNLPGLLWTTERFAAVAALQLHDVGGFARLVGSSRRDSLTGCLTYGGLIDAIDSEIERSERRGHLLSCCFIDVDEFKEVNRRKGHLLGNRVLSAVGEALRDGIRTYDVVGRFGGDEFVVLLPETNGRNAQRLVERLHRDVRDAASAAAGMPIDAAFGEAQWREGMSTVELLDAADRSMRASKLMNGSPTENGSPRGLGRIVDRGPLQGPMAIFGQESLRHWWRA